MKTGRNMNALDGLGLVPCAFTLYNDFPHHHYEVTPLTGESAFQYLLKLDINIPYDAQ
jgi:hypothetical protein